MKAKVLFNQKKKDPAIEVIENLSSIFAALSSSRVEYAHRLIGFGADVFQMTKVACPEYVEQIQAIRDILGKIAACNVKLAEAEFRVSDDIRDISERFVVVERVNNEFKAQEDTYEAASNALIEILAEEMSAKNSPGYQKVQAKIEAAVIKAKVEKNTNNKILKEKIQALINTKEKYNSFKVRRLNSAWKRMSISLENFSKNEASLYKTLNELLARIKSDDPSSVDMLSSISEVSEPLPKVAEETANKQVEALKDAPPQEGE